VPRQMSRGTTVSGPSSPALPPIWPSVAWPWLANRPANCLDDGQP